MSEVGSVICKKYRLIKPGTYRIISDEVGLEVKEQKYSAELLRALVRLKIGFPGRVFDAITAGLGSSDTTANIKLSEHINNNEHTNT